MAPDLMTTAMGKQKPPVKWVERDLYFSDCRVITFGLRLKGTYAKGNGPLTQQAILEATAYEDVDEHFINNANEQAAAQKLGQQLFMPFTKRRGEMMTVQFKPSWDREIAKLLADDELDWGNALPVDEIAHCKSAFGVLAKEDPTDYLPAPKVVDDDIALEEAPDPPGDAPVLEEQTPTEAVAE